MHKHSLRFSRLLGSFSVCRLPAGSPAPSWAWGGAFFCAASTPDEVSVVCLTEQVLGDVRHEGGWACFKLEGPFPFNLTGVLASFLAPLAANAIPIFAISTFDTDYVLVKEETADRALAALREGGHEFLG
jgi:hypothetical protein